MKWRDAPASGKVDDRRTGRKNDNGRIWKPVKRTMFITNYERPESKEARKKAGYR